MVQDGKLAQRTGQAVLPAQGPEAFFEVEVSVEVDADVDLYEDCFSDQHL